MPTNSELINIHVRTLFTRDAESRLLFVNEPDNVAVPDSRLFLGRTHEGNIWRFRADLPEKICRELGVLCADEPLLSGELNELPRHFESFIKLLGSKLTAENVSNVLAYHFVEYETPSKRLLIVTEDNAEVITRRF